MPEPVASKPDTMLGTGLFAFIFSWSRVVRSAPISHKWVGCHASALSNDSDQSASLISRHAWAVAPLSTRYDTTSSCTVVGLHVVRKMSHPRESSPSTKGAIFKSKCMLQASLTFDRSGSDAMALRVRGIWRLAHANSAWKSWYMKRILWENEKQNHTWECCIYKSARYFP